ncbi:hypothetical protein [Solimonas sp. SE-A11]|uniref:hypothetical protein n=1 Tax=Solimonas sp. SE-A11 TaxID=3054954 RepID=UPI00259CE3EA|nr:hypothetical protein [Solimonas sp. SE-A11]MDM4772961.1 hypothetical protein [Solimonas sp. SE-A11]
MRKPSWLVSMCIMGALSLNPAIAMAATAYYSGFAYLGDFKSIEKNFPYTTQLTKSEQGGPSRLDVAVLPRVKAVRNPILTIEFEGLGKLGPDATTAIALALALDRETVSVEKIGGIHKIVVELSAQALFFDFKEKAVIASYPIIVQYIDVVRERPDDAYLAKLVSDLYLGNVGVNLLDEFSKRLETISLNTNVSRRIQVSSVNIGSEAQAVLPPQYADDEQNFRNMLAQQFSSYLSVNQKIPVLPYTAGYAISNRMAARFEDGSVFDLKIPEPDYTIDLDLAKLRRIDGPQSAAGMSVIYGAQVKIKVSEPLSGKRYFDAPIKQGASKGVPKSQENVDDWAAFQETILQLMNNFTSALDAPTAEWAEKHASDKSLTSSMSDLRKVLQSCK